MDGANEDELRQRAPLVEAAGIRYRQLEAEDLERIGDIDRTERIRTGVIQHGARLEEIGVDWDSPPWLADGEGEHSVAAHRAACEHYLGEGATVLGAFGGERLVGIGLVKPHVRSRVAQLAYLHVSDGYRAHGIGAALSEELERVAREAGRTEMVVSATPSANTVRFYLGRGYEPMAEPLPELLELEPEDIHVSKRL